MLRSPWDTEIWQLVLALWSVGHLDPDVSKEEGVVGDRIRDSILLELVLAPRLCMKLPIEFLGWGLESLPGLHFGLELNEDTGSIVPIPDSVPLHLANDSWSLLDFVLNQPSSE